MSNHGVLFCFMMMTMVTIQMLLLARIVRNLETGLTLYTFNCFRYSNLLSQDTHLQFNTVSFHHA